MVSLYPDITPHAHGMLAVGDGHHIYWEACGNPQGTPALVLHGGPGAVCTPTTRRYFDPERYHVVLFDQRSCGRSLPHAGALDADLSANTTHHLIGDIEQLRHHLGIERWLVFGRSWGSTLALAYAQRHAERVAALVLGSVATTTPAEIDWITRGVGAFFPEAWERFRQGVPEAGRDGSLVEAYHRRLMHPDAAIHSQAASDWCAWEHAIVALEPGQPPHARFESPAFRLCFARLVTHYWCHAGWLADGELLAGMPSLAGIPGILVHGRLDLGSPLQTAWQLAQAWPGSELVVVATAGHSTGDLGMADALVGALNRLF
jgi:proline iminopeptidase